MAAKYGHTDVAIALVKAKANINAKDKVRVGLAGWMVVCVQRLSTLWGRVRWSQGGDVEGVLLQRQPCRCHFINLDDTVFEASGRVGGNLRSRRHCLSAQAGSG